jgi:hypothetical protein
MKKQTGYLLGLVMLAMGANGVATFGGGQSGNLVGNGDFEAGPETDGLPAGWHRDVPTDTAKIHVSDSVAHAGKRSACIETTTDTRISMVSKPVPVVPGEKLTLSVWCRVEDLRTNDNGTLIFSAGFLYETGAYYTWQKANPTPPKVGEWFPLTMEVEVPNQAAYVTFEVGIRRMTGKSWWDDADLRTATPVAARFAMTSSECEPGETTVPLMVLNRNPQAAGSTVQVSVSPGGRRIAYVLTGSTTETVAVPAVFNRRGKAELSATIKDDAQTTTLFVARRNVTVPPTMFLEPPTPTHFCIEDGDPAAQIGGRAWVHEPEKARRELRLRCTLKQGGKTIAEWRADHLAANPIEFGLKGPANEPGDYVIVAELLHGEETITSATQDWHVIHRSQAKVVLGNDGYLVVDGKRFFPIGLYQAGRYDEMKSAGFNVIQQYDVFSSMRGDYPDNQRVKEYLDKAAANGLRVVTFVSHSLVTRLPMDESVRRMRMFRNHPALLVWYEEEAVARGIRPLSYVEQLYGAFKKEAPEHPVLIGDLRDVSTKPIDWSRLLPEESMDIGIWWWYPTPLRHKASTENYEGEKTGDELEYVPPKFLTQARTKKPLWIALQCYKKPGAPEDRYPTPEEYRVQAYIAVIHGAKGLLYYTGTGERGGGILDKPGQGNWEYLKKLAGELRDMSPVFMAADAGDTVTVAPSDALLSLRMKQCEGKRFLLAANRSVRPANVTLSFQCSKGVAIPVRYESRSVTPKDDGRLEDHFDGYAVHIYELP